MAGGCFGLCPLLRRNRNNRRGPGAGPAQEEEEEEVQHFQPLQQDPGRDRPEEQDRARGRFRRAVQRLLRFVGVRRRTATTAPPELTAQPDTSAAELEAEPDGSTAPRDCAASGDMEPVDGTATSDTAVIDGTDTTDMAATDFAANCDVALVDSTATCDMAPFDGTATSAIAPMDGTDSSDTAQAEGIETSDLAPMDGTATCDTALTDTDTSSDTAPTAVRADATTEGIADTDCTPMQSVVQPDTSVAELEAEPDVSIAPIDCAASGDVASMDCAASSDMEPIDCVASGDMPLTDGTATSEMAATYGTETTDMAAINCAANCAVALVDSTTTCDMAPFDGTATSATAPMDGTDSSDMAQTEGIETSDMAPMDGTVTSAMAPVDGTATSDTAQTEGIETSDTAPMDGTETSDTAAVEDTQIFDLAPMDGTDTCDTALTDTERSSDTAPTDVGADDTTEGIADTDCTPTQSSPPGVLWSPEPLRPAECGGKGSPSHTKLGNLLALAALQVSPTPLQVPASVSPIHQWLTCRESAEVRPPTAIRRLAQAHPGQVVTTLLRCAPACDRAAAILWRTIASSATTVHKVLPTLLGVMEDWPLHSVSTSNGDHEDVFALAATLALWLMVQEPQCQDPLLVHAPRLLLALLCQVSMCTEEIPQEVSTFWRGVQEQHGLPTQPNSFVVQTIQALLWRLQWDQELVSVERKRGWDALLSADTHHYAVGLLAREMRRVLVPSYGPLARHLLGLLSREGPRWELPALAFLVEVLDYLDVSTGHDSVLRILARHLQSQCPERRRLALRGLLVLSVDPSMAKGICSLSEHLLELLRDGDGELVGMTLSLFRNVLQDEEDSAEFSSTALRLVEVLRPVFDNDNSHVQLLSIRLFREVMELLAEEGTEPWEVQVRQSLVPLFFRWQDENQRVAEAAREALLWAASFLHRKDLEQLLKTEQPFRFCDCLMEKDVSGRGQHLHQALPYLQSPQEPLREAAVRFMGVAGWHMREEQQDLWPILKALAAMSEDDCPSTSSMRAAFMATYSRAIRTPPAPLRRPMSLQQPPTTAQGPLLSAAAAAADAGPN
ncbi:uncharacterized protein LOC113977803 [Neopelma chrysocephalum]|uniref:uncharacterized protein LOC113977803 n=1 Tax=Neopelma chrysocephalum TaxID=114329 RepID=UPI000FCCF07C|nr:uncharacterized protein LOC113977803 [Neopelma chrysocephalum]